MKEYFESFDKQDWIELIIGSLVGCVVLYGFVVGSLILAAAFGLR